MKKIILIANAIALAGFISSCGNSNEPAENNNADSTAVDSSAMNTAAPDESQEYISIPAPDEMFSFMKAIPNKIFFRLLVFWKYLIICGKIKMLPVS